MSKLYNELKKDFTIAPNELINDFTIDARARFLFIWLCSKPEGWKYYTNTIEQAVGVKKGTRLNLMRELINAGWVTVNQEVKEGGKFGGNIIALHPRPKKPPTVPGVVLTAAQINGGGQNEPLNKKDKSNKKDIINKKENTPALFGNEVFLPGDVLNYLNERLIIKEPTRRGFANIDSNLKHIKTLCKNKSVNYTLTDFKAVIDDKVNEWHGKPKTQKWLRPSTLFGEKFDTYLTNALSNKGLAAGDANYTEAAATNNDLL